MTRNEIQKDGAPVDCNPEEHSLTRCELSIIMVSIMEVGLVHWDGQNVLSKEDMTALVHCQGFVGGRVCNRPQDACKEGNMLT